MQNQRVEERGEEVGIALYWKTQICEEREQKKLSWWMSLSLLRKIWSASEERQEMGQAELLNILNIWNKGHYPMIKSEWSTHGNPWSCLKNRIKMRLRNLPCQDTKNLEIKTDQKNVTKIITDLSLFAEQIPDLNNFHNYWQTYRQTRCNPDVRRSLTAVSV